MARRSALPLDRLSAADQAFVREQLGARDEVKEVKKDEFVSLFDGKTLDGWKVGKNADSFTVRDGIIVVDGRPAFLFYDGPVADHNFKNFHFKADVMTYPNANSGIFFHTRYQEDGDAKFGAECQVNNSHRDWRRTGSLIGVMNVTEAPPGAGTNEAFQKLPAPPARDEVWFTQEIIVQGRQVVVKIDGNTNSGPHLAAGDPGRMCVRPDDLAAPRHLRAARVWTWQQSVLQEDLRKASARVSGKRPDPLSTWGSVEGLGKTWGATGD